MSGAEQTARTFFERLNAHDLPGALSLLAPGATVRLVALQRSGGPQVVEEYLRELLGAFTDLHVRVRRLFGSTDGTAVAEVTVQGVQSADFLGIVNQERLMDLDQVWLLHATGGTIDRVCASWGQNRLYRRLGVKRLDRITITA
jgi:hypothetical protein